MEFPSWQVKNLTSTHEDVGLTLGLAQWIRHCLSCGEGHRHSSDLAFRCCGCGVGQQLQLQFNS